MSISPVKILLAEDNPDHAELTMDVLKDSKLLNEIVHVVDGDRDLVADLHFCGFSHLKASP